MSSPGSSSGGQHRILLATNPINRPRKDFSGSGESTWRRRRKRFGLTASPLKMLWLRRPTLPRGQALRKVGHSTKISRSRTRWGLPVPQGKTPTQTEREERRARDQAQGQSVPGRHRGKSKSAWLGGGCLWSPGEGTTVSPPDFRRHGTTKRIASICLKAPHDVGVDGATNPSTNSTRGVGTGACWTTSSHPMR